MFRKLLVSLTAMLALVLVGSAPAFAYGPTGGATVSASSTTVAPGQPITLSGSGFAADESVSVNLDSTVHLTTVQATSTGTFSATVTIPSSTSPGKHTITATGLSSGAIASFSITVTGATTTAGATLPFTGANVGTTVGVGVGVLALGGLLVLSSRKRRRGSFTA